MTCAFGLHTLGSSHPAACPQALAEFPASSTWPSIDRHTPLTAARTPRRRDSRLGSPVVLSGRGIVVGCVDSPMPPTAARPTSRRRGGRSQRLRLHGRWARGRARRVTLVQGLRGSTTGRCPTAPSGSPRRRQGRRAARRASGRSGLASGHGVGGVPRGRGPPRSDLASGLPRRGRVVHHAPTSPPPAASHSCWCLRASSPASVSPTVAPPFVVVRATLPQCYRCCCALRRRFHPSYTPWIHWPRSYTQETGWMVES
jgi:hypothetical protein